VRQSDTGPGRPLRPPSGPIIVLTGCIHRAGSIRRGRAPVPFCKTSIMLPPRHSRRIAVLWLALALAGASAPDAVHAQDTLKVPATSTTAPRVNLPAGTRITRPPVTTTVARPPASTATTAAPQQIVTVPDLAGRTVDEARRLLAGAGLVMGSVTEAPGSGTPGTVVQQQPRAGSAVAPKSDVRLWVAPAAGVATTRPPLNRPPVTRPPVTEPAQEPALVTVPRLAGRTVEDARALLARLGLEAGAVAELAGTGDPGTILRQVPQAGARVAPKTGVRMWIVAPRVAQVPPRDTPAPAQRVTVPSVAGQTVEDARKTLAAAGLGLGALAEAAGTGTPGTVARQQPAAGASVAPDARVRLWLVPARTAVVPAIMGLPLDRAQALLRQAGLRPGQVAGEGRVIGHTHEAGASVPLGSVVNISLGAAAGSTGQVAQRPDPPPVTQPRPAQPAVDSLPRTPPVVTPPAVTEPALPADSAATVPDVRRLALPQAQAALAAAGFTAAFDAALADSAGWIVSAQQPSPGGRLASGGVVALLLDPPASAPIAAAPGSQPPAAGGEAAEPSLLERRWPWIALAALLLVAAVLTGAQRMRSRTRALPVAGVSARLRMDTPARVAVEGDPFGPGRLRFRMNPGRSAARVAAGDSIFVRKEVSVD
jgi:beta-lactam-binding protein with PASTA domain